MKKIMKIIQYELIMILYLFSIIIVDYDTIFFGAACIIITICNGVNFVNIVVGVIGYIFVIIPIKLLFFLFRTEVNDFTVVHHPFFKFRTINQGTKFKNRLCKKKVIYMNFLNAIGLFTDCKLTVKHLGKYKFIANKTFNPIITTASMKTHEKLILHILKKYEVSNDDIDILLNKCVNDKGEKVKAKAYTEKLINYKSSDNQCKQLLLKIKYTGERTLIEKCILEKNPFSYLAHNFDSLKVDNYDIRLKIIT